MTTGNPGAGDRSIGLRTAARRWLELAVLVTFAFGLPLFQLFDESPEYLIARGNAWPDILIFTVALLAGLPAAMVGLELLAERVGIGRPVHLAFVGLLVAAIAVQALKEQFESAGHSLTVVALVIGAIFALVYARWRFLPEMLLVLSPATLVVAVWFLGFSAAAELAWPAGTPDRAATPVTHPLPVVLVIFDEFSAASLTSDDRVDARKYPNFAELARSATWFPNATTVVDNTVRAVPAILSGHLAARSAQPVAENYPNSIFQRLRGQYAMHVQEPITNLCDFCPSTRASWWPRLRRLTRSSLTIMRQRTEPGQAPDFLGLPSETIEGRPEHFRDWARGMEGGRTLNVAHVELPHMPYQYDATGHRYTRAIGLPGLTGEQWTSEPEPVAQGQRRYLAQLKYVDVLLGDLISEMKAKGLWNRALLVVTADHGVAFTPGKSRRNVELANVGEIAGVPLFIRSPGQPAGRVSPSAARTVDVLPTIGSYLGARWPGRSLRKPVRRANVAVEGQFTPTVRLPLAAFELRREAATRQMAPAGG